MSSRRGAWIVPRIKKHGLPHDIGLNNRLEHLLPLRYQDIQSRWLLNSRFNHALYGLEPDYAVGAQIPSINDAAPSLIASGILLICPGVSKFTPRGVVFSDESFVDNIDAIIFATGQLLVNVNVKCKCY